MCVTEPTNLKQFVAAKGQGWSANYPWTDKLMNDIAVLDLKWYA